MARCPRVSFGALEAQGKVFETLQRTARAPSARPCCGREATTIDALYLSGIGLAIVGAPGRARPVGLGRPAGWALCKSECRR